MGGPTVIELIYDTSEPDVAEYIKTHKPPAGVHWLGNSRTTWAFTCLCCAATRLSTWRRPAMTFGSFGTSREAAGTAQALPAEPAFRDLIELLLDFEAP